MKYMGARASFPHKALVWFLLVAFAFILIGAVCHVSFCPLHGRDDEKCPVCETYFWHNQLLRLAGLLAFLPILVNLLNAGRGMCSHSNRRMAFRATLVSLRVKLSD